MRDFVNEAARELDMSLTWHGDDVDEYAVDQQGNKVVDVDPPYFRPTDVETLLGDASQAQEKLGWEPKISFSELIQEMVQADYAGAQKQALLNREDFDIAIEHES